MAGSPVRVLRRYFDVLAAVAALPGRRLPDDAAPITWAVLGGPTFSFDPSRSPMFFEGEVTPWRLRISGTAEALVQVMFGGAVDAQRLEVDGDPTALQPLEALLSSPLDESNPLWT